MKSVLVLQNEVKAYRKPVYNQLAHDYQVTVLHTGRPSLDENDRYREVITSKKMLWRFHIQPHGQLVDLIKNADVVIAMFDLSWPSYITPLFWRNRPKYVLWGHWYSTSQLANRARNYLMKRADRMLMYGEEEVQRMVESGIDPIKIVIAPNTVHIPDATDSSGAPKRSFLFIGRLQAETRRNSKRADLLIEAFAQLQGLISEKIVLNIVGGGDEKGSLEQLAKELGIADKVIFHGHIDNTKILSKLFIESIALVSPGHVGLSVLQAFGHGVPVVTGKAIQYREETQHLHNMLTGSRVIMGPEYYNLKHEINSILVESKQELKVALKTLCDSPGYAQQLGSSAFTLYNNSRSLTRMVEGFKKAIEQ